MPIKPKSPFEGNRPYQVRARQAFPILVQLAKTAAKENYSNFATQVSLTNPRNCDYVLGSVAEALNELSDARGAEIPRLTTVIVNSSTDLPGDGLMEMLVPREQLRRASIGEKRRIAGLALQAVYTYPDWDGVLRHFGLEPLPPAELPPPQDPRGGGESKQHLALKHFVRNNPGLVRVPKRLVSELESLLHSGDRVDVLFYSDTKTVAVEVKTSQADVTELVRGVFQCVKYRAVLEAEAQVKERRVDIDTRLVLQGQVPPQVARVAKLLGVPVIDCVSPK